MNQRGILIRLIDVGLIILLGFVSISDITVRAQIKLPSPRADQDAEEPEELVVYYITIHADERVSILGPNRETTEWTAITRTRLDTELPRLRDRLRAEKKQLVVLLEPELDTSMQALVDVLDICQRHRILKNIANKALEL